VVFASHGWTFSTKDRSGHGSVIREDMIVPFIIAGPGICRRTLPTARQVDIMPTILDVLGDLDKMKAAGPIDGISLLPLLTSTQPVCSQPTTTATRPTTRAATRKVHCLTTYPVTQPAMRATTQTKPSSLPASQAVR
jgi:arylsulfatase A-like enzyme